MGLRRVRRIPAGAEAFVEAVEDLHLLGSELEVEDLCVLFDARWTRRLRDHDEAMLNRPAQHDLGRGSLHLLGDAGDRFMPQAPSLRERAVALDVDLSLDAKADEIFLR